MYKMYNLYPTLLIISAFGPYLSISLGVKTDNLVAYLFASLFFVFAITRRSVNFNKPILLMFYLWTFTFIFLVIRTFMAGDMESLSAVIAECKNFTQPLAILTVFLFCFYNTDEKQRKTAISKACKVLVLFLCINTLWILLGFFVDLTPINHFFWKGEESTAAKAMTNGRYSGVFNQPMEAGVAYSIGLLAWLYLVENKVIDVKVLSMIKLILMIAGGLLTVSKVFMIGGLFLFVMGTFLVKNVRKRILRILLLLFTIGYPLNYYLVNTWDGLSFLLRFFDSNSYQQGFVSLITAGRYGGNNSQQSEFFSNIWQSSPIYGEGLGSQQVLDSGFFHFFADGGLIGLVFYVIILLTFCCLCFQFVNHTRLSSETKFFFFLVVLIILSSFGAPVLTLNRSSAILWVFIGLLLNYLSLQMKGKSNKYTQKRNYLNA